MSIISTLLSSTNEGALKAVMAQMQSTLGVQILQSPGKVGGFEKVVVLCTDTDVVVMCLDQGESACLDGELADEERFNYDDPKWFSQSSHRVSPVHRANQLAEKIDLPIDSDALVSVVLVTKSYIINFDEMTEIWADLDATVVHQVRDLSNYALLTANAAIAPTTLRYAEAFINSLEEPEEPIADNSDNSDNSDDDFEDPFDDLFAVPPSSQVGLKVKILEPMPNPQQELEALVGLQEVKKHIQQLIMLNRYNARLQEAFPGCETHKVNLHSCFLGGVGTGKTTMARLMGSLLAQAGVLSRGHVVVADRGTFIGKQFGCEEENVRKCLEAARGGVLMIDEAYLLVGNHHEDPGQMVVQLLLDILADERERDLAVILCGYEKQMQRIFDLNPGIVSRFPNIIRFPNYTLPELLEISRRKISKYQYTFTNFSWSRYAMLLGEKMKTADANWANAREVANLLETIYINHAQRCCSDTVAAKDLRKITVADMPSSPKAAPRRSHIGFN